MPSVIESIINPYNGVATYRENVADAIDAIDRREVPLLKVLGWSLDAGASRGANSLKWPCTQALHQWQNDELIPNTGQLNAAYASGSGSIALKSGESKYFVVDEVLVLVSGASTTHLRITAINTANDTLTVTALAGDAAHAVNTRVYAMGRPATRGEPFATTGKVAAITADTNFTQIFGGGTEGVVAISETEQSTAAYGIEDQYEYQKMKKLAELVIRLEMAMAYGERSAAQATNNDQPATRMGGLFYFIARLTGGQVTDASAAALSTNEDLLRNALDGIWDQGGSPSLLLGNTFQRRQMSDFLRPFVRTDRTEGVYGVVVNEYEHSHGTLQVGLSKWIPAAHLWILSPEHLGIGPLNGNGNDRSFSVEELPKDGDYRRCAVVGEYVAEVRNRQRAHGLIHNLATS